MHTFRPPQATSSTCVFLDTLILGHMCTDYYRRFTVKYLAMDDVKLDDLVFCIENIMLSYTGRL